MTLTPQFLDELRARTSLSTLVGKTTKLTKAGREYKGCCPFHNEKTPSFYVNDDKGFYHCFGCSAHGDAIRWMTDQRGLPFMDAVKELAQSAGLELPAMDRQSAEKAERAKGLHEAMADAAAWFVEQLGGIAGTEARALLDRRGITPETARAFGMGFAPDSRGKLKTALKTYGDAMLVESGMLIQVEGKDPYDRFRGRLMIPIRDARGRTIAFGGRILDQGEPKYLNSPETPLFDKGRTLYNLDRASAASRKAGRVIVVEGYMDVIALAQAGIGEAVAPLGTALTEPQLERLWRMADSADPVLRRRYGRSEGGAARRASCAADAGAGAKPVVRDASCGPGSGRSGPRSRRAGAGDGAVRGRATGPAPVGERVGGRGARHPRTTCGPAAAAERSGGHDRRSGGTQRISGGVPPPLRRAVRARTPSLRAVREARQGSVEAAHRRPVGAEAKAVHSVGIDRVLAKAVLAGLIRHPAEIARHVEILSSLRLGAEGGGGALGRLFEAVVDLALEDQALDSARLLTILARSGFDGIASDLLRADSMPYSFTLKSADPLAVRSDLDEAIAILVARPEVDAALGEATAAMQARFTDEAFERQVTLVREKQALDVRLANLVQATEDARALGAEGD